MSLHSRALVCDAFGNYVVQYALDQHIASASQAIMVNLSGGLIELGTQMFSSHVVEKVSSCCGGCCCCCCFVGCFGCFVVVSVVVMMVGMGSRCAMG